MTSSIGYKKLSILNCICLVAKILQQIDYFRKMILEHSTNLSSVLALQYEPDNLHVKTILNTLLRAYHLTIKRITSNLCVMLEKPDKDNKYFVKYEIFGFTFQNPLSKYEITRYP